MAVRRTSVAAKLLPQHPRDLVVAAAVCMEPRKQASVVGLPGISAMLEKKLDRAQVAAVGSKMQRRLTKPINRVRVDMARQIFHNSAVVTVRSRGAQPARAGAAGELSAA